MFSTLRRLRRAAALAALTALASCVDDPVAPPPSSGSNPLAGAVLWVDPSSPAARQAEEWRASRPADAALMDQMARGAQGVWILGGDPAGRVAQAVAAARAGAAIPVLVAYNVPRRDCQPGLGAADAGAYQAWIRSFASGVGDAEAIVVLEPDALPQWDCLSPSARDERVALLRDAVGVLAALPRVHLYVDAGHARWHPASETAARLRAVGAGGEVGFALNVSNFVGDDDSARYGNLVSQGLDGAHFVVDTSRNGRGPHPDGEWCNPPGRALGRLPVVESSLERLDAWLWIKRPGESDGTCNGGPPAGQWWPAYALELARRASWTR